MMDGDEEGALLMNRFRIISGVLAAFGLAFAAPALAHHSPASFDLTKRTTMSGVIQQAMFRNPHGKMVLNVKVGNAVEKWEVETSAANLLRRRGWNFTKFRPGASITVYGHLNKTLPRNIYVREVRFADGTFFGDKEGNDKALD
ncbi:MAG: hypothetical protein IT554_01130 [Sphingomonadaceae bacterium]|nr:hypothetical protein [Sphingomonadaceae bacterium]